jgi:hypothetical protein
MPLDIKRWRRARDVHSRGCALCAWDNDQLVLATTIVELLVHVHTPTVWATTTKFAKPLVHSTSEASAKAVLAQTTRMLELLVAHYLDEHNTSASRSSFKAFYELIESIMQPNALHLAELQRWTLARLTPPYFAQLEETSKHILVTKLLHLLLGAEESARFLHSCTVYS